MSFVGELAGSAASLGVGIGLIKCIQYGGKKIAQVVDNPVINKVGRISLGILGIHLVNAGADYLGLQGNIRLFVSIGVAAESIISGVTLGCEMTQSEDHYELAKMIGNIAAVSLTASVDVNTGAGAGFLAGLITTEILHAIQVL